MTWPYSPPTFALLIHKKTIVMKKIILVLLPFLMLQVSIYAQLQDWAETSDANNKFDNANATDIDNAGNRYVGGTYIDTLKIEGISYPNYINDGSLDGFIAKYDADGNLQWVKTINGEGQQDVRSLKVNRATGECYVSGSFNNDFFIDGIAQNSYQYFSVLSLSLRTFLVKFDANGNMVWSNNTYSLSEYPIDGGHSIAIAPDGNSIYFHNAYIADLQFESGESFLPSGFGVQGIILTRMDATTGSVIVAKNDIERYLVDGALLACDKTGNVIFAGSHRRNCMAEIDAVFAPCDTNPSFAIPQGFIWKLTSNFGSLWGKEISGNGFEVVQGIATDDNDNVYAYGTFDSPTTFDATTLTPEPLKDDAFVVKLNSAGNYSYIKQLNANNLYMTSFPGDYEAGFAVDKKGNAYLGGSFTGTLTMQTSSITTEAYPSDFYSNGFVFKLNPSGNVRWVDKYAGSTGPFDATTTTGLAVNGSYLAVCGAFRNYLAYQGDTITADINAFYLSSLQDCDVKINITATSTFVNALNPVTLTAPNKPGYTYQWQRNNVNLPGETSNTLVTTLTGNYKCIVTIGLCTITSNKIKLNLLVKEGEFSENALQIFPNPAHDKFTLIFDETVTLENIAVDIIDITGRKIFSTVNKNIEGQSLSVQLPGNTTPGVYFVQLNADGINTTTSIVIE